VSQLDLREPPYHLKARLLNDNPDIAKITWDWDSFSNPPDITGITGYKVYRDTELAGTTSDLFFEDDGISFSSIHYYTVATLTDDGIGPQSYKSEETRVRTRPAAPVANAEVSSSTNRGKIRVSWKSVVEADSYLVYRSDSEDGQYTKILDEEITEFQFFDTSSLRDTLYYYAVTAVNMDRGVSREGNFSAPVPMISRIGPTGVIAEFRHGNSNVTLLNDSINIKWDAYLTTTEYRLYRKENDSKITDWTHLETLTTRSYTDKNDVPNSRILLASGTNYIYRVSAVVDGFETEHSYSSNSVLTRPDTPQLFVDGGYYRTITWSKVKGADGYTLYFGGSGGDYVEGQDHSTIHITDLFHPDAAYWYEIWAYNSSGRSPSKTLLR